MTISVIKKTIILTTRIITGGIVIIGMVIAGIGGGIAILAQVIGDVVKEKLGDPDAV